MFGRELWFFTGFRRDLEVRRVLKGSVVCGFWFGVLDLGVWGLEGLGFLGLGQRGPYINGVQCVPFHRCGVPFILMLCACKG